jgi:hypothetical protein
VIITKISLNQSNVENVEIIDEKATILHPLLSSLLYSSLLFSYLLFSLFSSSLPFFSCHFMLCCVALYSTLQQLPTLTDLNQSFLPLILSYLLLSYLHVTL